MVLLKDAARLEDDLAKMDFTHVAATLLRWEGCGRTTDHPTYRGLRGCPGISDSTAVTPAVPRFSAVGLVPLLCAPGISLLLSRSEGMNCSSMRSQELKHCCQEPHADLDWTVE